MFIKNSIIIIFLTVQVFANQTITLQFDWLSQFQFAGYIIAKEKKFYKSNNLDVKFKYFNKNSNILDFTLKSDAVYSIGKSSLIIDKMNNKKIILLASIYQDSPMILLSLKNSYIKDLSDLKNKKVMLTKDVKESIAIELMLKTSNISLTDMKIENHSLDINDLISGRIDVICAYISNEPYLLKDKNIPYNIFNPNDYFFNFYGGILYTSQKELYNHPKRVSLFTQTSLKGWEYAFENIEETAKIIYEKYNPLNKSLKALIYEGKTLKKLAKYDEGLLGDISKDKIKEIIRLYAISGLINKKIDINNFIYQEELIYLNKAEKEYLKNNKINFISNDNYKPFTQKIDGKYSGIEFNIWNLIEKKLNIQSNIKIINNNRTSLKEIKDNKNSIKFSFSNFSFSEDYIHTNTIYKTKIAMATLNDKSFTDNFNFLTNKKIAINKFSNYKNKLKKLYPKINFIETKSLKKSLQLLKDKKVYGILEKLPYLSQMIASEQLNNIKISATLDTKYIATIIVNKDNEILLNILNKVLKQIKEKDINKIKNKYNEVLYIIKDKSHIYKYVIPLFVILIIVIIFNLKMYKEIKKRKKAEKRLENNANKDPLTNIFNRRKLNKIFKIESLRSNRYKNNLAIIFIDIDDFKYINDNFGHEIGDEVLKKFSQVLKKNIRKTDSLARWGGEEFIILLPDTNDQQASLLSSKLIKILELATFAHKGEVSASFGISQYKVTDKENDVFKRADEAMYYVKTHGKNGVKIL